MAKSHFNKSVHHWLDQNQFHLKVNLVSHKKFIITKQTHKISTGPCYWIPHNNKKEGKINLLFMPKGKKKKKKLRVL